MRGYRHVWFLVVFILIIGTALSGCSSKCAPDKTYEKRANVQTVEKYADEPYTVSETKVVGEKCIERHYSEMNDSRFNLSIGDIEWLKQPPVEGETNYLRRVVVVHNARNETDAVYLDKIYLYNGTETKRSKTPMMFLVEPKTSRTLYFMWDTQYDKLKDLTADFTNNTEQLGFTKKIMRMCYNETEKVNLTKYRKVVTGTSEEVTGYDDVVRVKLKKDC
jgi:hypothetical protein